MKPENEVFKGDTSNKKPRRNGEDFDEFDTSLKGIIPPPCLRQAGTAKEKQINGSESLGALETRLQLLFDLIEGLAQKQCKRSEL